MATSTSVATQACPDRAVKVLLISTMLFPIAVWAQDSPPESVPPDAERIIVDLEAADPQALARCRENFCVVRCKLTEIDWLHLRFEGHQRALFTREEAEWSGRWIAP